MADTIALKNPSLIYPLEEQGDYKGRITFTALKENYRNLSADAYRVVTQAQTAVELGEAERDRDGLDGGPNLKTRTPKSNALIPQGSVQLYLPQQLQFGDAAEYANVDLGILGAAAATGIRNAESGAAIIKDALKQSLPSISSIKQAFSQGLQDETTQIAALKLASNVSSKVEGAIETEVGITLNPNKRSTFKEIGVRRFNFTFAMVPTSQSEADQIRLIVAFFRHHMYPELVGAIDAEQGFSAAFRFPSKFRLNLTYGGRRVGPKILPCFLERVNVTYNPNAMAFHTNGDPQETQITLSFLEERALNRNDIIRENTEEGFTFAENINNGGR